MASNGFKGSVPLENIGENHPWRDWFVKLAAVVQRTRFDILPAAITPGASPYTYQNSNNYPIDVYTSGGTVSAIAFSRDGSTFYSTGFTSGVVGLSQGDYIKVTYTVAPTMTQVPR